MADVTASNPEPEASVQETPMSYVKTKKGLLLLATEALLSLAILICNATTSWYGSGTAIIYLPIITMTSTATMFVIYATKLDKECAATSTVLQRLWGDFIRAVGSSVLYLIYSLVPIVAMVILHVHHRHVDDAGIAGVVFSVIAGLVYAYDAYTVGPQLRSSRQQNAANAAVLL